MQVLNCLAVPVRRVLVVHSKNHCISLGLFENLLAIFVLRIAS